tara:strand:+ start:2017 stop:3342 length:1326 start_codon:yes stop_codon:yes gene_type:complete
MTNISGKIFNFLILLLVLLLIFIFVRGIYLDFSIAYFTSKQISILIIIILLIYLIYGKIQKNENFLIVFISIAISFFVIELFLTLSSVRDNKPIYKQKSKFDIYNYYKEKEQNFIPTFSLMRLFNKKFVVDGSRKVILSMPSNTNMIHCLRDKKWLFFKTDRYGFNNNDSNWENYDTVMIGDSFGIGECVNYQDSLSGQLEKLKKINGIINLSQTGNGPLLKLAILQEYGEFKKIKNLIWFYFEGNDLLELNDELKNKYLFEYIKNDNYKQNLVNYQSNINQFIFNFINKFEKEKSSESNVELGIKENHLKKYINFFTLSKLRSVIELKHYNIEIIANKNKDFEKIILNINKKLNINNGKFYFVYLPTLRDVYSEKKRKKYEASRINIEDFLIKNNIQMIDIYSELYLKIDNPYKLFDKKNGHYTIWGYKKIANIINNQIL